MLFKNVIGQIDVKLHLVNMVQQNRISHALLFLGKEFCQTFRGEVRAQKAGWSAGQFCDRLCSEVAAANGAFHGCRPASGGPVTGEEYARPICDL